MSFLSSAFLNTFLAFLNSEESPLCKAPIYKNKTAGFAKEAIPNCWEALESDHTFEISLTKKCSSRKRGSQKKVISPRKKKSQKKASPVIDYKYKRNIYANHFDETLQFELPKG